MAPNLELEARQARVLGVLIEKQLTTPDNYPLSLHALTAGCNQKSNRDPVLDLASSEAHAAFEGLRVAHLGGAVSGAGSRVEKYRHTAEATLGVSSAELAVLAELILRGPQTPGDLRGRANRMAPIDSIPRLQEILDGLMVKGLVLQLAPLPGSRAPRFEQLLAPGLHSTDEGRGIASSGKPKRSLADLARLDPDDAPAAGAGSSPPAAAAPFSRPSAPAPGPLTGTPPDSERRLQALEAEVRTLRQQLATLAGRLGESLDELGPA